MGVGSKSEKITDLLGFKNTSPINVLPSDIRALAFAVGRLATIRWDFGAVVIKNIDHQI